MPVCVGPCGTESLLSVCVCPCMQVGMNGDTSQWDSVMQLPHYSAAAMPAVSMHQVSRQAGWVGWGAVCVWGGGRGGGMRGDVGGGGEGHALGLCGCGCMCGGGGIP